MITLPYDYNKELKDLPDDIKIINCGKIIISQ